MARYATKTAVGCDRTKAEIEATLERYQADKFMYGWAEDRAILAFRMYGRAIRLELPLPSLEDHEIRTTPTGRERDAAQRKKVWEQARRQRWRALSLVVKAKLEAVEAGITSFEDEFLAYTVLPDGSTVAKHVAPRLKAAFASGEVPLLIQ